MGGHARTQSNVSVGPSHLLAAIFKQLLTLRAPASPFRNDAQESCLEEQPGKARSEAGMPTGEITGFGEPLRAILGYFRTCFSPHLSSLGGPPWGPLGVLQGALEGFLGNVGGRRSKKGGINPRPPPSEAGDLCLLGPPLERSWGAFGRSRSRRRRSRRPQRSPKKASRGPLETLPKQTNINHASGLLRGLGFSAHGGPPGSLWGLQWRCQQPQDPPNAPQECLKGAPWRARRAPLGGANRDPRTHREGFKTTPKVRNARCASGNWFESYWAL